MPLPPLPSFAGRAPRRAGLLVVLFLALSPGARAHVNSGVNCQNCHGSQRDAMTLRGFTSQADFGAGERKVFEVAPGGRVTLGIDLVRSPSEYGFALSNLETSPGVTNATHRLAFTADSTWTKRNGYYSAGPSTSGSRSWSFQLDIKASTPADAYPLTLRIAGTGGGRWNEVETFYIRVVAPAPAAPSLAQPTYANGAFSCSVTTQVGFTYFLEARRQLTTAPWVTLLQWSGDGSVRRVTDPDAGAEPRFYRVRVE